MLDFGNLRAAERSWKLSMAQKQAIYAGCLRGEKSGGTVCTQGFAVKHDSLIFFVQDPQNSTVITIDGTDPVRYDQWFTQHEFWKSEGNRVSLQ